MNRFSLKFATLLASVLIVASVAIAQTPGPVPTTDVLGVHDLSAGTSPLRGANANACIYCHTPHGGLSTSALWNQTLSTKQYTLNPGTTGNPITPTSVVTGQYALLELPRWHRRRWTDYRNRHYQDDWHHSRHGDEP